MMRRNLALALGLVLLAPLFTGCLGLGGDDGPSSSGLETESQAQASEKTGGLEGIVTDSAVQPIVGVEVTLTELGKSTTTTDDGSFAFSNVQPGAYTLKLEKEGFIGTEKTLDISSGDIGAVEIVLTHEPSVTPYTQQFAFNGFLECSLATPAVLVAVCAIPNVLAGGNATNDRFIFYHQLQENPWQMVTEMSWEPGQPLARDLSINVEPAGLSNDGKTEYGAADGASPLIVRTDRERFTEVTTNTTAVCNEQKDPESSLSAPRSEYCNRDPVEDGGRVQVRVFVDNAEATTAEGIAVGAGAAIQQDFSVISTVFYNTPACEEYSVLEGNTCEQLSKPPANDPYSAISGGNETQSGSGSR